MISHSTVDIVGKSQWIVWSVTVDAVVIHSMVDIVVTHSTVDIVVTHSTVDIVGHL